MGAPVPPTTAPLTPPAHSCDVRISAHTPRVRGGPFGYVLGGPIFRLPLRFIGATAVGQSSEEAGASSDWLGALVFGWDTQSRRHRGAGCVKWLALCGTRRLSGSGLRRLGWSEPCPGAGRLRAAGRHCLACECTSLTCKSRCPVASREVRVAWRGQEPLGQGRGAPALPPCPSAPGHPPILSFLSSSLHWRAQEPTQGASEGNSKLVPSRLCTFFLSCLTFLGAFWFFAVVGCFLVCSRPFFICSSFLALTLRQLAQQPEAGQPRSAAPGQRVGHCSGDPRHGAHGVPPGRGQGQAGRPGQAGTRQPEVAQQPC